MKSFIILVLISFALPVSSLGDSQPQWRILNTAPYGGKQDDIFFINHKIGWYVNGDGSIYRSDNGGESWSRQLHLVGTYFRAITFVDENLGFAGNIGVDYFPGVSDSQPLYQTKDGGTNWTVVKDVNDQDIKGICALDSLTTDYINAGHLEKRTTIYAAGRVGGPAKLVISRDAGTTWKKYDLTKYTAMIQDVKFINESIGFLCAGSEADISKARAQILKTSDGGTTWKTVYQSSRSLEITWKCSFPTDKVGYASILSFDKDTFQKYVVKTIDGGDTWQELPLAVGITKKLVKL
ncbi:MAG: hypothetical protein V4736_15060 [Bdellovibrionota bacterium]